MINDTTAGRWFRRVMWLGILANLALALPTIAAPDMMIEFTRLPTATPVLWPRFAGLLLVILSVFYTPAATDIDRYRVVAWFAIGSRAAGVLFFVSAGGLPHAGTLRPRVPGSRAAPAAGRRQRRLRFAGGETRGVEGLMPRGRRARSGSASRIGLLVVVGTSSAILVYEPSSARSRRRTSRLTRIISSSARSAPRRPKASRTGSGWCCRGCSPICCRRPAGTRSLGFLAKDGHEMPIGFSKVTVGFPRVGINCAVCHAASYRARPDEPPTIVAAAASHQTSPQQYLRFLFALPPTRASTPTRCSPRSRGTRGSRDGSAALPVRHHPTTRRELLRQREPDAWMRAGPTGAAAGSIRSTR